MVRDISGYLRNKETTASKEMAEKWSKLDELHSKRLWHQLTVQLLSLVKEPELQSNKALIDLYENFIREFELRYDSAFVAGLCLTLTNS